MALIAFRDTADGKTLGIHDDGTITTGKLLRLAPALRGLGRPATTTGRRFRAAAVRLVMDSLPAFDVAEVPSLVRAAERTFRHTWDNRDAQRAAAVRAVKQ